jgi:hypothetical protein
MLRMTSVRQSLVLTATLLVTAPTLAAQALPSAEAVIAKHVAAVGGKEALKKLTSIRQVASMELPSMGMTAEAEVTMGAPNRMATKMTFPGLGDVVAGTDGHVAWSVNPMQGPRVLADKELAQTLDQADFYGNLLYETDRFSSMTNEGIVDFAGEKAYKLKLVRKASGLETWQYFSVTSGLQIGTESSTVTEMGTIQSSTKISEYKDFGGLKFPTRTEVSAGPQTMIMTVKDVQLNSAGADSFAIPATIQPLIKK